MRYFEYDEGEGCRVARTAEPLPPDCVSITLPEAAMKRVAGVYRHDGHAMTIVIVTSGVTARIDGQPTLELLAESATRFFLKDADVILEFPPDDATAASVTSHQGGKATTFERVAE